MTYLVVSSTPERRLVLRKEADAPLSAVDYAHDPYGWQEVGMATTGKPARLLPLVELPVHVRRAFEVPGALLPGYGVTDPNPEFWRVQILHDSTWRDVRFARDFPSYDTAETQAIRVAVHDPKIRDWRVVPA